MNVAIGVGSRDKVGAASTRWLWIGLALCVLVVPWNLWSVYGSTVDPDQEDALPVAIGGAIVMLALVAGLVFRPALQRAARPGADVAKWALPLSIAALVLFLPAFWSGAPFGMGVMGAIAGRAAQARAYEDGRSARRATGAVRVGVVAAALSLLLGFVGVWL